MSVSLSPLIKFSKVEVKFSDLVYGLRGITLDIAEGEFVFLCGPTGSGKSTILKLLYREAEHTQGVVTFKGKDLGEVGVMEIPKLRRQMGIVPQDFALLPQKRVWENIAYAMRAVGATSRQVRAAVPGILEQVNIAHRADAYPHQLSGGEQQRVAIGRALINNPKLLLADEPTANLDPEYSLEIVDLLVKLNAAGATVVVASHDMGIVDKAQKRVVRVAGGLIESDPGVGNV
ncbi:MAG: ATP-binding cassette domain-containing protein [Armatimonadetes bacterium]|nr:ATP-binding cassette domain-containing protein [Armatimonadota bacterium]